MTFESEICIWNYIPLLFASEGVFPFCLKRDGMNFNQKRFSSIISVVLYHMMKKKKQTNKRILLSQVILYSFSAMNQDFAYFAFLILFMFALCGPSV